MEDKAAGQEGSQTSTEMADLHKTEGHLQHGTWLSGSSCLDDSAVGRAHPSPVHITTLRATVSATHHHKARSLRPPQRQFSPTWARMETELSEMQTEPPEAQLLPITTVIKRENELPEARVWKSN